MTTPYTYVINCPDGRRYYGVRFARNCHPSDLWSTYFTSSQHIKSMITKFGKDSFTYEIRKIFDDVEKARDWEETVLQRLKVNKNPNWVNICSARSRPIMSGDNNPSKRDDVREKISKGKIGKARPDVSERLLESHHMKDPSISKKVSQTRKEKFASGEITIWSAGKLRPDMTGEKHHRFGKKYPKLGEQNRIEYTCPHCGKIGKGPGMNRYHFDNCKVLKSNL